MRAKARPVEPTRTVTVQVMYYDALGTHPPEPGESYTYELPEPSLGGNRGT
jgi:hypothetical protein